MVRYVENLVVGGGLAGTWTAFQFLKAKRSFALISQSGHSRSSEVAAGIFNPLLPARQRLSYKSDEIYPYIGKKYHEMESVLHAKVLHQHHIAYLISELKGLNDWASLSAEHIFKDFVMMRNERISDSLISDFGFLDISHSGWVNIPLLLSSFVDKISEPNIFLNQLFVDDDLEYDEKYFYYGEIVAKRIVFCQGTALDQSKYTSQIKLIPAKGEILTIKTDEIIEDLIPQLGVFMLPLGDGVYRVGSNFNWKDLSYHTSEAGKEEILNKFKAWYKAPFEIIDHVAGVRPSSADRRPILGKLPFHHSAYILNGLGSKGVALAPYYSEMLVNHILNDSNIDDEVNVNRYLKA